MRNTFIEQLLVEALDDPRIMLVVGDLGYGVVDEFASRLPAQFLNAGVAEQNMVGVAAGLAASGYQVYVYSIANFPSLRAIEQIRNDVCYHNLDVKIVSVGAGLAYGNLGYSHHAIEDVSITRPLPRLVVVTPADPAEATAAVRFAHMHRGPMYIRLGKNGEPLLHPDGEGVTIDQPLQMRSGSDVTLLGTGAVLVECLAAAEILGESGTSCEVWSVPLIRPLKDEWLASMPDDVLMVTVEEHVLEGGFGSAVLERLNDTGLVRPVLRIGVCQPVTGSTGDVHYLRRSHGLDAESIAERVRHFVVSVRG